jgi:hypothetical protein
MSIGTVFTLFVLPCLYMLIAKQHRPAEQTGRLVAQPAT